MPLRGMGYTMPMPSPMPKPQPIHRSLPQLFQQPVAAAKRFAVRACKRGLDALGWELRRSRPSGVAGSGSRSGSEAAGASNFGEEKIISDWLERLRPAHRFCVDIGAGDGAFNSNSLRLFRAGWSGLAAEWDAQRFAKLAYRHAAFPEVRLCRARVNPDNVLGLLSAAETPRDFGFLSLDIDSFDYFVLEKILSVHRPALICAEINEKIPPPIRFSVKWDPGHHWAFDHFYGQSLSMLENLGSRAGYLLVGLEYNNAFLIPKEICPEPGLTVDQAYHQGYLDRPDRLQKLPWNRDMEFLQALAPEAARAALREKFAAYAGGFVLE